jgi:amino-acid N-acetyltransferase
MPSAPFEPAAPTEPATPVTPVTTTAPPAAETPAAPDGIRIRPARTRDVRAMRALVAPLAEQRVLLQKEAVAYYESVGDFVVAERDGEVVGCGAVHVLWEDLAEIRTLAVASSALGHGIGTRILDSLVARAVDLGVERLFCLTFETEFFARHGFAPIEGQAVEPEVYLELLRSYDEGVAEFLDLERVKPNTLGNTRMLRVL